MIIDFLRSMVGEVPQYNNDYGASTQFYADCLEYGFACILLCLAIISTYRIILYIVNLFRGKGGRKI